MGTQSPHAQRSIADALFPVVRQRVLALFFGNPSRSYFSNEVFALAQSGRGAVQRELASLALAGLVTVSTRGNQKHYAANKDAPVFAELRGLVLKTSGLVDVLRAALAPLASQIDAAFVYGSVSKRQDTAASDVDLMVVSDSLGYADVYPALEEAGGTLARKVNPTIFTHAELARRMKRQSAFATRVLSQEKLWVIGSEKALYGTTA
jgi:predicted nucleotidyltransferase